MPAIQRRVDAGAANAVEVTRAQNATATARIESQQAARDLATARWRLAASWGGRTPRFESVAGDLENLPPVPSFETLANRLSLNPSLARYSAETAQRQAEIARAKAQAVPDVTVAVGGACSRIFSTSLIPAACMARTTRWYSACAHRLRSKSSVAGANRLFGKHVRQS